MAKNSNHIKSDFIKIAVLVVIAAVLGYKIYQQSSLKNQSVQTNQKSDIKSIPQSKASPLVDTESTDYRQVLNFPDPNASDVEKKKHSDLVNKLGNESGSAAYLDISGCKPTPIIYRIKQGNAFKVKNSDPIDHVIYTDRKTTIKANTELVLESKAIGDNFGDYGYGCDGSASSVGIIQIVPS